MQRLDEQVSTHSQALVDLYGCDAAVLDDLDAMTGHVLDAARAAGAAAAIHHQLHRRPPRGVAGTVILGDSHLAIHTWPDRRHAALDLFKGGEPLDEERCIALLRQRLRCERVSVVQATRGDVGAAEPPAAFDRTGDQILHALARLGASSWGRLLDAQDGTLAEFHAALEAHRAGGRVTLEAGVATLTPAGRAALGARGAAPAFGLACAACDARGYRVDESDPRLARLEALLAGRPGPSLEYDQGAITPADALLRASFIEDRGDLTGRSLLMIGDFDLLSLALVMTGKPERVVVLDVDERVVGFVNRVAAREGFPLGARAWDVRRALPADLERGFDVFLCDPVETLPGIRLFLSRGAAGLRGAGTAAYVGLTTLEASRRKWFDVEGVLHAMGFAVTDARRRFSGYPDHDEPPRAPGYVYPIVEAMGAPGIEHRWYTAALVRAESVRAPEPAVRGDVAIGPELYVDDEAWATPRSGR